MVRLKRALAEKSVATSSRLVAHAAPGGSLSEAERLRIRRIVLEVMTELAYELFADEKKVKRGPGS